MPEKKKTYWVRGWDADNVGEAQGKGSEKVFVGHRMVHSVTRIEEVVDELRRRGARLVQVQVVANEYREPIEGNPDDVIRRVRKELGVAT